MLVSCKSNCVLNRSPKIFFSYSFSFQSVGSSSAILKAIKHNERMAIRVLCIKIVRFRHHKRWLGNIVSSCDFIENAKTSMQAKYSREKIVFFFHNNNTFASNRCQLLIKSFFFEFFYNVSYTGACN